MKVYCLVMDNVPIHIFEDIVKYIVSQGYRCAYLPSYSSKLRLIDQFWSVVKSKVKHDKFLEKGALTMRISEAPNSLKLNMYNILSIVNDTAYKDIDYYTHMSISGGAKLMNSN